MAASDSTPDVPLRVCTKCGDGYPATTEYFGAVSRNKDGLNTQCRACCRQYSRNWTSQNREKRRETCRNWYHRNIERERQRNRDRRQANYDYYIERDRQYKEANREQIRAREREQRNTDPIRFRLKTANYTAKKRVAGKLTPQDVERIYNCQRGKCYYCGCNLNGRFHIDHVIPLSRGGFNTPENSVAACETCNKRKSNKRPHEWPEGGRLL